MGTVLKKKIMLIFTIVYPMRRCRQKKLLFSVAQFHSENYNFIEEHDINKMLHLMVYTDYLSYGFSQVDERLLVSRYRGEGRWVT